MPFFPFHSGRRSDPDGPAIHRLCDYSAFAAKEWADAAIIWYGYELGADSEYVQEMKGVIKSPQTQRAWGTRARQSVGGPLKKT